MFTNNNGEPQTRHFLPAFKVFTFTHNTLTPTDYRSVNYDLTTAPAQFNTYYTFSTAYSAQGSLDDSLTNLYPTLNTDNAKQALYIEQYNSGNNSANFNPITPTTRPGLVYGWGWGCSKILSVRITPSSL